MSSLESTAKVNCTESLLDLTCYLSVNYKPSYKSRIRDKKYSKYSKKLTYVQELIQHTQTALSEYLQKATKLKDRNKNMHLENLELKRKIFQLEESQKHSKTAEIKSPSNTSQRTHETEWFLSNEASFSVSSCSSVDSIVILNDQVDYIKEIKKITPENSSQISRRGDNFMQSNCNMEKFIRQVKQKGCLGWNNPSVDTVNNGGVLGSGKPSKFLNKVMISDVPIFRF
ncbi:hypothetical protein SteCoe_21831 [Stentor coeruleus]|uniref:Uncharacterized protein n=1 Tax=Stentor coeruleus TaxID=5963 RepID=A0A1R2BNN8_9CILI|nr:hypothetical protein SteCoe_21831 [Stentor coeruleus]